MTFHHVTNYSELRPGMLGILEPSQQNHQHIPTEDIDLFICPGLAFDKEGTRLGFGGGYYDRALARKKSSAGVIGVAMDLQILDSVPCSSHDISMDYLITEKGGWKTL